MLWNRPFAIAGENKNTLRLGYYYVSSPPPD